MNSTFSNFIVCNFIINDAESASDSAELLHTNLLEKVCGKRSGATVGSKCWETSQESNEGVKSFGIQSQTSLAIRNSDPKLILSIITGFPLNNRELNGLCMQRDGTWREMPLSAESHRICEFPSMWRDSLNYQCSGGST